MVAFAKWVVYDTSYIGTKSTNIDKENTDTSPIRIARLIAISFYKNRRFQNEMRPKS